MRKVIVGEWIVQLRGRAAGGPIEVVIENVEPKDRAMARALAKIAALWLSATRRPS